MASPAPLSNMPPPLRERLQSDHEKMLIAVAEIVDRADALAKTSIFDDESATAFSDMIKDISKYDKRVEALRVDEKEPFLESGRVVDGFFKEQAGKLQKAQRSLNDILTTYLNDKAERERAERIAREKLERERAEEARRVADEALRAAQEAEAARRSADADALLNKALAADQKATMQEVQQLRAERDVAARPADMARTRGVSSLATLTTSWESEVQDFEAIPLDILRPHIPRAAIEQAIRSFVRAGGRELAGVKIYEQSKASVR